jgi:Uma2 family endonuclease
MHTPGMSSAVPLELVPGLPVRYPVTLRTPRRFRAERPETWPRVEGRLCADTQSDVVFSINVLLGQWLEKHRDFVGATNEAGLFLQGSVRAADAAVWRKSDKSDLGAHVRGTLRRVPPVLAVEVAGQDEDEAVLTEKAAWYLGCGVNVVWLVFPESRSVVVVDAWRSERYTGKERLRKRPSLPGLAPRVSDFFAQLDR